MQYVVGHLAAFLTIPVAKKFDDLRKYVARAVENCSILDDIEKDLKKINYNYE